MIVRQRFLGGRKASLGMTIEFPYFTNIVRARYLFT